MSDEFIFLGSGHLPLHRKHSAVYLKEWKLFIIFVH